MTIYTLDLNGTCSNCGRLTTVVGTTLCLPCNGIALDVDQQPAPPPASRGEDGRGATRLERIQRPSGRGLAGTLFDLILRAERAADQKFHSLPLPNGLTVEVGLGEQFNLRLYRKTAPPSAREWQTVIDYLPECYKPENGILPRDFKHTERDGSQRWYLEGHWPFRQRVSA
jgi:hypothetical protein